MQQRKQNRIRPMWFLAVIAALVLGGCAPFGGPVTPALDASATPGASPQPTSTPTTPPLELPIVIEEGFESGLAGWEKGADVPEDPNNPGQPVAWSIQASSEQATEGQQSARFTLDGSQDDGTIWIGQELAVPPDTELAIAFSLQLWSASESFNTLANVAAYAGPRPPEAEEDFDTSKPANLAEGWRRYDYSFPVRSDAQGRLWLAAGISVVWETEVTYYLDRLVITIDSAGPHVKPPPAVLAIGGQEQVSGIGSYCWSDLDQGLSVCADSIGVITPEQPLIAPATFTAQFRLAPEGLPSELSLRTIAVTPADALAPVLPGSRAWPGGPGEQFVLPLQREPELDLTLEPGLYVLDLFARWDSLGDVSYGFLVEVPAGSGERPPALEVDETPIVADDVMAPYRLEYLDYLGEEIQARIEGLRTYAGQQQLAANNEALAPFGYRLESHFDEVWHATLYDLYEEGETEPMFRNLWHVWPVSVSASGTDFVLPAENAPNTQPTYLLIRPDGVEDWHVVTQNQLRPAFVGDQLAMAVTISSEPPAFDYEVQLDGQAVYSGQGELESTFEPLRGFNTWDGHWALEVNDHVIVDGQDLGESQGYDAVFEFHILHGQPFYFFEQEGLIRLSYAGETLPFVYHEVVHSQCCEPAAFNVEAHPDVLWFHGRVDDMWYFVEAGVYEGEMAGTNRYTAPEGWSFRYPAHWDRLDEGLGLVQETATGKTVTFASQPATQDELEAWLEAEIARKLGASEADNSLVEPLNQLQDGDLTVYRYAILSQGDGSQTLLLSAVFFDGQRRYEFYAAVPPVAEEEFSAILASFVPVAQ
ncbi:MAG: hypothetical protein M8467_16920 [Anaerolineae bacterium]|nr:hypothetical protein [Anaerolineae bacterium]